VSLGVQSLARMARTAGKGFCMSIKKQMKRIERGEVVVELMPRLYVWKIPTSQGQETELGWEVSDESGNICEGPFTTREEARLFRRDILTSRMQLGGSERYAAFWTPGERGITRGVVDAGKIAQKEYEAELAKWREKKVGKWSHTGSQQKRQVA